MNAVERVRDILISPKKTWPIIDAEQTDITTLYTQYIMFLALVPVASGFIGALINAGSAQPPLLSGIVNMVVSYALSLGLIYLLALLANRLAPNLGGERNLVNALKLIAYGGTPSLLGGIFLLAPPLWPLGLVASLYSVYLLFLGIPVLMKSPKERALSYTVVLMVGGFIANVVLAIVSAIFR